MYRSLACIPAIVTALALFLPAASGEQLVIYKHDQFADDLVSASSQISGTPLPTQPGFVAGEAFGQVYHPSPGAYPVKLQGIDLFLASPPAGGTGQTHADIEVWFHDGTSADPGKAAPDFTMSTKDVFDPISGNFGLPLQGNTAMQIDFNWDDLEGHPPELYEGSFTIAIRFTEPAQDLQTEWGTFQCAQMSDLGMCGCQQVGTINDQATTDKANVIHIIYPAGNCYGTPNKWAYTESLGVTGDFILRARALAQEGPCTPNCTGKECGSDGCGGSCGGCAGQTQCVNGKCPGGGAPVCAGKECGDDTCGGSCGQCGAGHDCVDGQCISRECPPVCEGKECGSDGCGGSCGDCPAGEVCVQGACQTGGCAPQCEGKECGDDTCGGVCGVCPADETCQEGICQGETSGEGELAIVAVSPNFGYEDAETNIAIDGTGFALGATVMLGADNLSAVQVVSAQLITATVPSGMVPATYMLVVINTDGKTASLIDAFEVKEAPLDDVLGDTSGGCRALPAAGATGGAALLLLIATLAVLWRRRRS